MATSKLNIFNALPQHGSDSEDETNTKNAKNRVRHEKQDQRRNDNTKGAHGHTAPKDPNQKEDVARQKGTEHKTKQVTAEPHPNDRHSGTGNSAYGGKPKKSGAGKGNWGNFKEDRKAGEEGAEGDESPAVVEEEKPEGITLSEYFANKKVTTSEPQVNEAKSKITSEQLMKELGKATALKTRVQQDIDDKKVGKKKDKLDVNHKALNTSEHADLLNFRTGFVEKEYKERVWGEEGNQPRRFGGDRERGDRKRREEEPAQPQGEGAQTEAVAPVEGQTAETATPTEGQAQPKVEGQQERRRDDRRDERQGGNYRGGRGGYNKGGDRPQGDRPQGERRPYGGNKGNSTKVNIEDESAFPKLG